MMEKKPANVKRSMSLSKKMNDDLLALTEALGVNAHSYMINEIAKSIQRDSLTLNINTCAQDVMSSVLQMLSSQMDVEKDITDESGLIDKETD